MRLVAQNKLSEIASHNGRKLNLSKEFREEIDKEIIRIVEKAVSRALENGRFTLMKRDL
jgi:histone H3/H4